MTRWWLTAAALLLSCTSRPSGVVVLHQEGAAHFAPACPPGRCELRSLKDFSCPSGAKANAVILAGHVMPPQFLGTSAEELAKAVACYHPALVVVDTCYGTSTELMRAFVNAGVNALVVGSPRKLPKDGFDYAPEFWGATTPAERAKAVRHHRLKTPIVTWTPTASALDAIDAEVASLDAKALESRLQREHPNLVKAEAAPGVELLVRVPSERFR